MDILERFTVPENNLAKTELEIVINFKLLHFFQIDFDNEMGFGCKMKTLLDP